jgi:hypothetical protein
MATPSSVCPSSPFALAVCQPGAEAWLKREVARQRPDLHPGFQRPGLVTFKATARPFGADEAPPAIFARAWACSAGPQRSIDDLVALAERVGAARVFVGARDAGVPDATPPARLAAFEATAAQTTDALRSALPSLAHGGAPLPGERVLDVIVAPDEPVTAGWHVHGPERHAGPCGRFAYDVPADLPSRAWRKVVEGLIWSGAELRAGQRVLEFGAAPGGGTRAFAERGARVIAVDPQPLDPAVLSLPGVTAIRRPIGEVRLEDLPADVDWIACDAGIAPAHVVAALRRLIPRWRQRLRGLLLTLKLNDDATVDALPALLARIAELRPHGVAAPRAIQLPANRRDVFVYAPFPASVR